MTQPMHASDVEPVADSFSISGRRALTPSFRRGAGTVRLLIDADERLARTIAAVAAVLARQSDAANLVVGCAGAGRSDVEPVRLHLAPDSTCGELLNTVNRTLDGHGREDPPESGAAGPLPAVVVADAVADMDTLRRLRRRVGSMDGLLLVADDGSLSCDYPVDRWTTEAVRRMLDQVVTAAAAISTDPDRPVARLDFAGPAERRDLRSLSETISFDDSRCLHEVFEEMAERHPDRLAVVAGDTALTYRRLDAAANQWANRLAERGVGPGERVGLLLGRSPEFVVAMLAVLKVGATYVPVDPTDPRDRQDRLVRIERLRYILSAHELPHPFGGIDTDVVTIVPGMDAPPPGVSSDPSTPAYILFTSGSTGEPKGVRVTHRNVVRLFSATRDHFGFGPEDRWLNAHNVTFDASVWEIYGAILHGACVVIAPPETARDPDEMVSLVQDANITMLTVSPTSFDGFRDVALERDVRFPALRFAVLCAEALNMQSLRRWFERWGDQRPRLVNMFGITETTVHSTVHDLTWEDLRDGRCRLGRGLADTPVYILDEEGDLVPFGVPGEIYVGGPGVAAGYVSAEPADHGRFLPDPHSALPGARMYRSGDRGRWLPDGTIEHLGRLDHQAKIRGFRIELGEVEAALHRHHEVTAARAWVARRPDRPPLLAAAVAAKDRRVVDPAMLRTFVAGLLPEYMVPAGIVIVDELPRTPNGKLAVHLLPDPVETAAPDAEPADTPTPGSALALVVDEMASVLGLPRAEADTNFFRSGGDSITAARLAARLRRLGTGVTLAHLYEHRTPRKLAMLIDTQPAASPLPDPAVDQAPTSVDSLPPGVVDVLPATRLQRGMLLHNMLDGEHVYHDVFSYTIDMVVDEQAFMESVRVAVASNPALRSSFAIDGESEARQRIHASADIGATFVDLRGLPAEDRLPALDTWAAAERATPFHWDTPGLLRLFVHRIDDSVSVLSISIHHALVDGWSISLTITALLTEYLAVLAGREPEASPDTNPDTSILRRYAALERSAEAQPDQAAFWIEYLAGATPTAPPTTGDGVPAFAREVRRVLSAELPGRIRLAAAAAGVPVKTIYLAAHLAMMVSVSGRSEVVTGVVTDGRPEEEGGDRTIGLFVNTLPIRLNVGERTWKQLIEGVFEEETRLQPYRRFPLERIQAVTGSAGLCRAAFNYTDFRTYEKLLAAGIRLRDITYREDVEFTLLVSVHTDPFEGTTTVSVKHKPAEMSNDAAHRYLDDFVDVLRLVVTDPEQQVRHSSAEPASESSEPSAAATALSGPRDAEGGSDPRLPSPLEPEVLAVWSRILGREVTDATTTFLEAGGDSLQLLDLYLQLRKAFQVDFPMRVLFRYPTARSFAHFITAAG